jgi:photosystem II stability/assembly factor-like uncharacterized protein
MMSFLTNLEGNFFTQTERGKRHEWRTCTGVGDVDYPEGEPSPVYCPDPLNSGLLAIEGYVSGEQGAGTYTLTKPLVPTWNFLWELDCKFVGRVNWVCRGVRKNPANYEIALLLVDSEFRRRGITNPVGFEPPESRINTNADMVYTTPLMLHRICITRQTVDNDADAYGVHFLPQQCEDRCGPARGLCEYGIIGLDSDDLYLYESEIKKTKNGGASWAETALDPYSYGGGTHKVLQMETIDGVIYIVFRGSAVAGIPAECGISDDYGATWNNVFIGEVEGQYVTSMYLSNADIYVGTNDGYIYVSSDQAATWSLQEDGTEGTEPINWIAFYGDVGYAVGDGNQFKRTLNNGGDWTSLDGPAADCDLLTVAVNDKGHVFIGTDDGRLFRSEDSGVTFLDQDGNVGAWLDLGGGTIDALEFDPAANYVGAMLYNTATPVGYLYRSEDGGASWGRIGNMPDNSGVNDLHMCDHNHIAMVGNVHNGYTFVAMTNICE